MLNNLYDEYPKKINKARMRCRRGHLITQGKNLMVCPVPLAIQAIQGEHINPLLKDLILENVIVC